MAIADLVLLHNKANDAQGKKDPISVDIFDKIPEVKREFLKFCKPFEARLRRNVKMHTLSFASSMTRLFSRSSMMLWRR